jgi:hypothetical protein
MRRLVDHGVTADGTACWFQVASPFETDLGASVQSGEPQWISAQIFKGAFLFEGNTYADVGSFQFYGMTMDSVVHAEHQSRSTGFHSWGQWHRRNDTGDHRYHNQPHPNLRVQYLGITLADGNGSPHAGMAMAPYNNFAEEVQFGNARD